MTPLQAIRAKCLDCSAGSAYEVRMCVIPECSLFPYRFGKNPNRKKRELTEEQKEALREQIKKARESRLSKSV